MRAPYVRDDVGTGAGTVAARIVYLIGSVIVALLALRFVLMLLGANPGNVIANFVYTLSQPFVSPFFGLFNYQPQIGVARFEFETLIALATYALLTGIITRALTLGRRD